MKNWSELDETIRGIEKEYICYNIYKKRNKYTIDEVANVINEIFNKMDRPFVCISELEGTILRLFLCKDNSNKEKRGYGDKGKPYYYVCSRIAGKQKGDEVKELIRNLLIRLMVRLRGCCYIDLNTALKKRGFTFERNWWEICSLSYKEIYSDVQHYNELIKNGRIQESLEMAIMIFGDYFFIRDFVNAKKWLDIVFRNSVDQNNTAELYVLWKKVESALEKTRIAINQGNHIVVNWIDGLRYDELENMPYLKKVLNQGIFFEGMYAPTDYTHAVEKAMFCEKLQIDDHSWEIKETDFDNHILEKKLKDKGYKTVMASHYMMHHLNRDYPEVVLWHYIYSSLANAGAVPSSLILYYGLCRLQSEEQAFCICHMLSEIHPPRICPDYPDELNIKFVTEPDKDRYMKQVEGSQKYLDSQIEFYHSFFKEAKYNIFMSDHGQIRTESSFTVQGKHHVIFAILGDQIQPRRIKKTGSLLGFSRLIEMLMNSGSDDICDDNMPGFALIQRDDSYGADFRFDILGQECKNRIYAFIQYRGVATDRDSYTRFVTGEEYYYVHPYEDNLIDDPNYQERIEELRALAGRVYIDIFKEDRYKTTREFYKRNGIRRSPENLYN